jgi:hypothetical protein
VSTPDESPQSSLVLYQSEDGSTRIQCRFEGDTLWLTQAQLAELFQTTPQNVTLHLKAIYREKELEPTILAVGYRIRGSRGTQFRQWATARLEELLVKGFTLDTLVGRRAGA